MNNINDLKKQAEYYRNMYISGYIDEITAKNMIEPYLNVMNNTMQKISKSYGRYFEKITFKKYLEMLDK